MEWLNWRELDSWALPSVGMDKDMVTAIAACSSQTLRQLNDWGSWARLHKPQFLGRDWRNLRPDNLECFGAALSVDNSEPSKNICWEVNQSSSARSQPEQSLGNYSKHSKIMMMMVLNLTCTQNSKYIRHCSKCLTGTNTLSYHNSFGPWNEFHRYFYFTDKESEA